MSWAGRGAHFVAVQESDIDLLILEQLHASPKFAEWWCDRLGIFGATFDGAWHSISNAGGETDVLLRVRVVLNGWD